MPGKQRACGGCQKVMRSDNLKKHEMVCKGFNRENMLIDSSLHYIQPQQPTLNRHRKDDIGDLINNVVQGAKRDSTKTSSIPPKKPVIQPPATIPTAVNPRSGSDLAIEMRGKSDFGSEQPNSEGKKVVVSPSSPQDGCYGENMEIDCDIPKKLINAFRSLYWKLHNNFEIYNELISMLDAMQRMNFLSREECQVMTLHLQKKINTA